MARSSRFRTFLRGQHWSMWVTGGFMVIAAAWYFGWQIADPRCDVPRFQLRPGEIVEYSKLVSQYTIKPICLEIGGYAVLFCGLAILVVLALTAISAVVGLVKGGRKNVLTVAFGVIAVILSSCACWEMALAGGGTRLTPLQTIRVDEHVIHLVRAVYPGDGMDQLSDLVTIYAFVCDSSGERCSGQEITRDYLGNIDRFWLEVDEATNQINVYGDGESGGKWIVSTLVAPTTSPPP